MLLLHNGTNIHMIHDQNVMNTANKRTKAFTIKIWT